MELQAFLLSYWSHSSLVNYLDKVRKGKRPCFHGFVASIAIDAKSWSMYFALGGYSRSASMKTSTCLITITWFSTTTIYYFNCTVLAWCIQAMTCWPFTNRVIFQQLNKRQQFFQKQHIPHPSFKKPIDKQLKVTSNKWRS